MSSAFTSKMAVRLNINAMGEKLRMWTFTFKEVLTVHEAIKRWKALSRLICKCWPFFGGYRFFEMHKPQDPEYPELSHGLHIHMVTEAFLQIDIMRCICDRAGFGRINVIEIPRERAHYVAKYLTKKRPECLRHVRLWAPVGLIESCRVRDVVVDSEWTRTYKMLSATWDGFCKLRYYERCYIVGQVYHGRSAADVLHHYRNSKGEPCVQPPWEPSQDEEGAE
jgi:hypothetical protein